MISATLDVERHEVKAGRVWRILREKADTDLLAEVCIDFLGWLSAQPEKQRVNGGTSWLVSAVRHGWSAQHLHVEHNIVMTSL